MQIHRFEHKSNAQLSKCIMTSFLKLLLLYYYASYVIKQANVLGIPCSPFSCFFSKLFALLVWRPPPLLGLAESSTDSVVIGSEHETNSWTIWHHQSHRFLFNSLIGCWFVRHSVCNPPAIHRADASLLKSGKTFVLPPQCIVSRGCSRKINLQWHLIVFLTCKHLPCQSCFKC